MSNHFHLVAAGDRPDAISHFMMNVNGYSATPPKPLKRAETLRAVVVAEATAPEDKVKRAAIDNILSTKS